MNKILRDIKGFVLARREHVNTAFQENFWLYPIDLDFMLKREDLFFGFKDEMGIPMTPYRSIGPQYNPTKIAAYGLAHWNRFLRTGNKGDREQFLKTAHWFLRSEDGCWYYNFDLEDMKTPWISCMAQGEGISLLLTAFHLTGDGIYLNQAQKALAPLYRQVSAGGVQSTLGNDYLFFEEYPGSRCRHVLNGFLYAIIGLIQIQHVLNSPDVNALLLAAKTSLVDNISRWDIGYWSAYCLSNEDMVGQRNACTVSYHCLHSAQLAYVGHHFQSMTLIEKAEKWERQIGCFANRFRALVAKIGYRINTPAQR